MANFWSGLPFLITVRDEKKDFHKEGGVNVVCLLKVMTKVPISKAVYDVWKESRYVMGGQK